MADTNSLRPKPPPISGWRKLPRIRYRVQLAFLVVWLAPLRWLNRIPSCVFHCYACPLASFACPVGIVANFSAWHAFPFLAVGVVLLTAAAVGSLACGWACPFGFIQDLLAKLPIPKFRLPNWTSYGRYVVLLGSVILIPYFFGEGNPLFICRICPAGAFESRIPRILLGMTADNPIAGTNTVKWAVLAVFLVAAVVTFRPWCKIFCPLGGFLSLFNRFSLFHLRFNASDCNECNTCRSRCAMGVKVDKTVNNTGCTRCLECVTCGAITPALALFSRKAPPRDTA